MMQVLYCPRCHHNYAAPQWICGVCHFGPVLPVAPRRTAAQQIALLMGIAGSLMLLPAGLAALFSIGLLLIGQAWMSLIIFAGFGSGIWLLINTYRYAGERIAFGGPAALWGGTLFYNLIGLLLSGIFLVQNQQLAEWPVFNYWQFWLVWQIFWAGFAWVCEWRAYRAALQECA